MVSSYRSIGQIVIVFAFVCALPLEAFGSNWQSERDIADRFERNQQNEEAFKHYQLALAKVPANDFANRAYLLLQISTQHLRKKRYAEAKSNVFAATALVNQLQNLGHLSDNLIYALSALREECNIRLQRESLAFDERKLLLAIAENIDTKCFPQQLDFKRCIELSRGYLRGADRSAALLCLKRLESYMQGDAIDRLSYQLRKALLDKLTGKPAEYERLCRDLCSHSDKVTSACTIAEAQTWVCDYDGALSTISQVRAQLTKSKGMDAAVQARLYAVEINNACDRGNFAQGESLCRKCLSLPQKSMTKDQLELVKLRLSDCLSRQNKIDKKFSSSYSQRESKRYEFLIEDEREAQRLFEQSHAKRKP